MKVGDGIETKRALWSFGGNVPGSFDEHVARSVPLYAEGHELICSLSDFFVSPQSTVYELGCSTGALTRKLALHNAHKPDAGFIGIDREDGMIEVARARSAGLGNVEWLCDDITAFDYQKSDMIVAYYTVQFLPEHQRQPLFSRIHDALNWGGAFVLFEKVGAPDARFQDTMTALYREFKLRQGYSAEEIVNKDASLKGVLKPFSTAGNLGLLNRAGFTDVMTVMKYVCFEGFLAIK